MCPTVCCDIAKMYKNKEYLIYYFVLIIMHYLSTTHILCEKQYVTCVACLKPQYAKKIEWSTAATEIC